MLIWGVLLSGTAVAAGAIGSHLLESRFEQTDPENAAKRLDNWRTAFRYQTYHGLALLAVGGLAEYRNRRLVHAAAIFFVAGGILFSGMLALYSLTQIKLLVAIVPVGGLSFLVGWTLLLAAVASQPAAAAQPVRKP